MDKADDFISTFETAQQQSGLKIIELALRYPQEIR